MGENDETGGNRGDARRQAVVAEMAGALTGSGICSGAGLQVDVDQEFIALTSLSGFRQICIRFLLRRVLSERALGLGCTDALSRTNWRTALR